MKNSIVTKYYFAGATRLAVRTDGTLRFLLGDHLGSSSVTTNASGAKTASALYKAFGETRFTSGTLSTDYKFTGQREQSELGGIYWFQSRWFDPTLGRFMSPDTIVPTSTQGTQAWDRYAFVNNNPVRYTDPTGHELSWRSVATALTVIAVAALVVTAVAVVVMVAAPAFALSAATIATAGAVAGVAWRVTEFAAVAATAADYFADQDEKKAAESSSSCTSSSTTTTTTSTTSGDTTTSTTGGGTTITTSSPDGTVTTITTDKDVTITEPDGTIIDIHDDDDDR